MVKGLKRGGGYSASYHLSRPLRLKEPQSRSAANAKSDETAKTQRGEAATQDVDRERIAPSPPTQTGQAVLPHPAFQFVALDGLAQALDSGLSEESYQPRRLAPRSPGFQAVHCQVGAKPQARFAGASGRTALRHYPDPCGMENSQHPTPRPCPLRSRVVTRFHDAPGRIARFMREITPATGTVQLRWAVATSR